ncbi:lipid A deacylase LpxR family protein [Niabella ginsengisoli]|uniref:Lipid A deacylase LpxR family protein n=1 Tax=Niabella ginsengisoli TaxID=522298 RepID=A0ABS9SPA0_9BACT|nr:lipid A deacylase LpxR family protein [Niabella ginsengisoli]
MRLAYQWRKNIADRKRTERVNSIYAGHNIYNSRFSAESKTEKLDRPITGYLYGGFQKSLYNKKQDLLRWGVSAGVIGPPARGAEVQKLAHKIARIYEPTYWDRQLKAAWGLNADIAWSPQIINKTKTSKWDFKPLLTATAGTLFTNAAAGGALVYGKFNKNSASAFWNNHQQTSKAERELFIYLLPMVYLKAYDATVQGGMFRRENENIPGKLNPVFFKVRWVLLMHVINLR